MKIQTLVFTVLALFFAVSLSAAPRMTLPEVEFDFGYAPQNSSICHVFWLKSEGDDSLKITQIVPGCGCTKAPLERDQVAPGDSTSVEIIFSTGSYTGAVTKSPRVQTNEGAPDKFLRIRTTIVTRPDSTYPLVIRPYKIDMSQFGEKIRTETEFNIENRSDVPLTLQLIASFDKVFDVILPKSIPAGGMAEGSIKLKAGATEQSFDKSFTIQVNDEQQSRFTIPVKRQFRTTVQVPGASPAAGK